MSSLSSIKIRREARQKLVKVQGMLRSKGLTKDEKEELKKQIAEFRQIINTAALEVDKEEVNKRREFLAANPGLQDIFNALWMIFFPYSEGSVLTKEGYTKFYQAISIALVGKHCFEDLAANIDKDWAYDTDQFGELNKTNFFDFLFETIGMETESHLTAFLSLCYWYLSIS